MSKGRMDIMAQNPQTVFGKNSRHLNHCKSNNEILQKFFTAKEVPDAVERDNKNIMATE
jgi:hypothetical protein